MKIIHFRLFMRKKGSMSMHASNRLLNFLIINVNVDVSFVVLQYLYGYCSTNCGQKIK